MGKIAEQLEKVVGKHAFEHKCEWGKKWIILMDDVPKTALAIEKWFWKYILDKKPRNPLFTLANKEWTKNMEKDITKT